MKLVNKEGAVTQMDLIRKAFKNLNNFKRHRALADIRREEKDWDKTNYHTLKMYQEFDQLELALRAIQSGQRTLEEE